MSDMLQCPCNAQKQMESIQGYQLCGRCGSAWIWRGYHVGVSSEVSSLLYSIKALAARIAELESQARPLEWDSLKEALEMLCAVNDCYCEDGLEDGPCGVCRGRAALAVLAEPREGSGA